MVTYPNDVFLDIANQALRGVTPIAVVPTSRMPEMSYSDYPEKLSAYNQCLANASQVTEVSLFYIFSAVIVEHVAVVVPPAGILWVPLLAGAGTQVPAGAAYGFTCVPPR